MSNGQALQRADSNTVVLTARNFLDRRATQIAKWVRGGVEPEALVRFALQDMQTTPALRQCTPESIYLALLACAVTGLEPGALKQEAFLIPYGNVAKFMAGWRGLRKQAVRSGGVKVIHTGVVYERDVFDYDLGTAAHITHKPAHRDRGERLGAYAWARLHNGEPQIEWVTTEDLEKIKKFAKSKQSKPGPWDHWEDEMSRKSALRRLAKYLPMDETYYNGMRYENALDQVEEGGPSDIEVLDIITDGEATRDLDRAAAESAVFTAPAPQQTRTETVTTNKSKPAATTKPAATKPPIDAQSSERPTSAAAPTSSPSSSASTSAPVAGSVQTKDTGSSSVTASPTKPAAAGPTTSTAGSTPPSSAASPAATSSSAAPPASATTAPQESSSQTTIPMTTPTDGASDGSFGETPADEGDTPFDTGSFGDEDPVDSEPVRPSSAPIGVPTAEQVTAFNEWAKTEHPDVVRAARAAWVDRFKSWVAGCNTRKDLDAGKSQWIGWAVANFKAPQKAGGGKPAVAGDPESAEMQATFGARYKAVPAS
jgi:recombination protein RecT